MNLPVTKLADLCQIPRPSMTQLLKGRNKKVSDEVISKIHTAFPQLSVMWLLFGEGDMLIDSNIKISEPQNGLSELDFELQTSGFQSENPSNSKSQIDSKTNGNRIEVLTGSESEPNVGYKRGGAPYSRADYIANTPIAYRENVKTEKHVVSIMVFYSDKSFETFVPEKKQ